MATQSPGRKRQLESGKKASTPLFNKLGSVIKKLFGRKNKKGETSKVDSGNAPAKKGEMRDSEVDYSTTKNNTPAKIGEMRSSEADYSTKSSSSSPTSTTDAKGSAPTPQKPKGNMAHMAIPEPEYPAAPTASDASPFNLSPKAKEDSGGYEYVKGPGRDNKRRIKVPKGKYPMMIGYDG